MEDEGAARGDEAEGEEEQIHTGQATPAARRKMTLSSTRTRSVAKP